MKSMVSSILLGILLISGPALPGYARGRAGAPAAAGAASTMPYRAAIVVDADSGKILFEKDAHSISPPASMTKMMLMLLVAERVKSRTLHWDDQVVASLRASKMGGSQVYLEQGEAFSLGDMMRAIVIHSANDAATAVAEMVAGSPEAFVDLMNERAKQLGMKDTTYHSVHGLPPDAGQQADLSSPYDMALVARELVKHDDILKWSGTKEAPFRNGAMTLTNTNRLVRETDWIDGLKTGFFREAGFNVTATARKDGMRLIAVVMGAEQKRDCFGEAASMLRKAFNDYRSQPAVKQGEIVANDVRVSGGSPRLVRVVAGEDLNVISKKGEKRDIKLELSLTQAVQPPLDANARIGDVLVKEGDAVLGRVPALIADSVRQASLWERIW